MYVLLRRVIDPPFGTICWAGLVPFLTHKLEDAFRLFVLQSIITLSPTNSPWDGFFLARKWNSEADIIGKDYIFHKEEYSYSLHIDYMYGRAPITLTSR